MTPPGSRAELPVPSKSSFVATISTDNGVDLWNTGHYAYMIDEGLKEKKAAWLAEVNTTYRIPNGLSAFTDAEFKVNSGYRNPYHQRFHVGKGKLASFHSRHPYGDALDVHTPDVNGNGTVEQTYNNEARSADGVTMKRAAESQSVGALWTASWEFYSTHTHADWTLRRIDGGDWKPLDDTVYSPPCSIDGTAASGPCVTCATTSSNNEEVDTPTPTITPSTITYTCRIHSGAASSESSDHSTSISGYSGSFYECQAH